MTRQTFCVFSAYGGDFFSVAALAFQPPPCQMLPSVSSPRSISLLLHHRFDIRSTQGVKLCHLSVCHTERSLAGGRGGSSGWRRRARRSLQGNFEVATHHTRKVLLSENNAVAASVNYSVQLFAVRGRKLMWKCAFFRDVLLISASSSQRAKMIKTHSTAVKLASCRDGSSHALPEEVPIRATSSVLVASNI